MKIPQSVKDAIRNKYAWPGGYPLFLVMRDGAPLCCDCGRSEFHNIAHSTVGNHTDGWAVLGADINWEDADLTCDNCNQPIESAYGDADEAIEQRIKDGSDSETQEG